MNITILNIVHEFILGELQKCIDELNLTRTCRAITANGKKCTHIAKSGLLCNKHKKAKNIKIMSERESNKYIIYHNHLPHETGKHCPRCNPINMQSCIPMTIQKEQKMM